MKKIIIDDKEIEISDESYEAFKKQFVKSEVWKPGINEEYWTVGFGGEITSWVNAGEYDYDFDYSIGNCFKTEEEAEEALKTGWVAYLQALKRLKGYIAEYGLEFEPDWNNTCAKHFIVYEHNTRLFSSDRYGVGFRQASSLPYFETENDAEQVIRDCEPELKILFGVK